jgi:hypothetical protein
MPGAVDNDDYDVINVTRGLYAAPPSLIPDGYAQRLDNIIIRDGILESRYPFVPAFNGALSATNGFIGYATTNVPKITPLGLSANVGSVIAGALGKHGYPTSAEVFFGWMDDGKVKRCLLPNSLIGTGGMTVYNKTLYIGTNTGVFVLNVSNFPTSLTSTPVAGSPTNILRLITHKSRLFGFNAVIPNRLYFTDAPAVGQPPEAWVTTQNFIDFNGPKGSTTIWDIVSLNNYIYVFTDNGLFSLYTQGGTTNWNSKLINGNIQVAALNQVATQNNLIYYITDEGVFVTDGFDFKCLSDSLTEYFSGLKQFSGLKARLSIFNDGIAFSAPDPDGFSTPDGWCASVFYTKLNNIAWTKFSTPFMGNTQGSGSSLCGCDQFHSVDVYVPSEKNTIALCLVKFADTFGANILPFNYYQGISTYTHLMSDESYNFNAGNVTTYNNVSYAFTPAFTSREIFGTNFMRLKLFKELYFVFSSGMLYTLLGGVVYDGRGVQLSGSLAFSPNYSITNRGSKAFKASINPTYAGSMSFGFTVYYDNTQQVPGYGSGTDMLTFAQMGMVSILSRSQPLSGAHPIGDIQ